MGYWADRCAHNYIIDNYLSNIIFLDSLSMRFDLLLFDIDETYLRCPQISGQYIPLSNIYHDGENEIR